MKENRFIEKFQHKTNAELQYILDNKKGYNPQAVAASVHILKERNGESPELQSLEREIETQQARANAIRKNDSKSSIGTRHILSPFKWILIILFFPISLIFVAYYRQKRQKRTYWDEK